MNSNKNHPLFTTTFFIIADNANRKPVLCKGYPELLKNLELLVRLKTNQTKDQFITTMKEIGNIPSVTDDDLAFLNICHEMFGMGLVRDDGQYVICNLVDVITKLINDYTSLSKTKDPEIERYLSNRMGIS